MLAPTQAELRTTQGLFPGLNESFDRTAPTGLKTSTAVAEIVGDGEQQLSSKRLIPIREVIQSH